MHLRWLDPYLAGVALEEINRDCLATLVQTKLGHEVSHGTVNRMLALIRSILRKDALEWDWLDKVQKFRLLPEPNRRIRWLTPEEAQRLLAELPDHLRAMAGFSLETGLRQANVTGLQWSQVDVTRRFLVLLDSSRPSQSTAGNCGTAVASGSHYHPHPDGQALDLCVYLPGQAGDPSEHQGVAASFAAGGHQGFSLA